jgi:hypothetical protein
LTMSKKKLETIVQSHIWNEDIIEDLATEYV